MKKLVLTLFIAGCSAIANAQLKYGADLSSAFTFNVPARPAIPLTPSLDLAVNQFRILGGADMFIFNGSQKNLFGTQFSAKYFFRYMGETHNFFTEANFGSLKYGSDAAGELTRYKDVSLDETGFSKMKSKLASLGGGWAVKCGNSLSFYCSAGGGLNFLSTRSSSSTGQRGAQVAIAESKTVRPIYYVRVGVNFTVNEEEYRRGCIRVRF